MLYEFQKCHKKKDESIHATYIITGEREVIEETEDDDGEGEDEDMNVSPFEVTPREKKEGFKYQKVVKLIGKERLKEVRAEIENIKTVHIYSLGPSRIKDLSVLSVRSETKAPGPSRPPAMSKASEKAETKGSVEAKSKPDTKTKAKHEPETKAENKPAPAQMNCSQSATKAALKKQRSSNLFTSWRNAANKKAESNPSSTANSSKTEGVPVKIELGSEKEEDFEHEDIKAKPKRRVREDVSDEEKKKAEEVQEVQKRSEDKPVELPIGSIANAVTEGGRRHGRRKVNKKVQVKDKDGYLVVKLEPAWESISEEEPAPNPKPKPKPAPKGKKKSA
ncbi:hypothetical protein C7212DRAFT_354853 [Tuber magnatum]|uniref:DNA polymerase delta subunit 3 n=1 Tax=Tuber magnatum TaxID=42249 RepID=A0A317SCM2_9PEZI|nr:hypothetical protein C7212DRAFT_354853 [Tuber magnatum]